MHEDKVARVTQEGAKPRQKDGEVSPGMVAVAVAVSGYLATGAVAKLSTPSSMVHGRRLFQARLLGALELVVAAAAAISVLGPAAQRVALLCQAVLLSGFVVVLTRAHRSNAPCECFGAADDPPSVTRLAFAVLASAGAWLLVVEPPGVVSLVGVVIGIAFGLRLSATRTAVSTELSHNDGLTRRTVLTHGIVGTAAVAVGLVTGWRFAPKAGAVESRRTLRPRQPTKDQLLVASAAAITADLLSRQGLDPSAIQWGKAVSLEDTWPGRTIVSLVAPIDGSHLSLAYVFEDAVNPPAVALLQADLSGAVLTDTTYFALDKGRPVDGSGMPSTARDFEVDLLECLGGVGRTVTTYCCALCTFVGGACCGFCAIGAAIGCLIMSLT